MRRVWAFLVLAPLACVEKVDPPALGLFQVSALIAELDGGVLLSGMPVPGKLLLVRNALVGPTSLPEFVDAPSVPYCIGSSFPPEKPLGGNALSGGDLIFSGLRPSAMGDLVDLIRQTSSPLRDTVTCSEVADETASAGETGLRYTCDVPTLAFLPGVPVPAAPFGAGTNISIAATGGRQVGAFMTAPIEVPPVLTATGTFDLRTVQPSLGVTAQWSPVNAPLVLIEILALRDDGAGAQILCLEIMTAGQKQIPAGALELVPATTDMAGLTVFTSLAAVNFETADEGWGSFIVGVGRGTFGVNVVAPGQ